MRSLKPILLVENDRMVIITHTHKYRNFMSINQPAGTGSA